MNKTTFGSFKYIHFTPQDILVSESGNTMADCSMSLMCFCRIKKASLKEQASLFSDGSNATVLC